MKEQQDPGGYKVGDKVRIRSGVYKGTRGLLQSEAHGVLEVELSTGESIRVGASEVTNYSRAARRAWEVMPKRAGRPLSEGSRKKMVSLRVDVDVWKALGRAADLGLITSREQAVNEWLRERLEGLTTGLDGEQKENRGLEAVVEYSEGGS